MHDHPYFWLIISVASVLSMIGGFVNSFAVVLTFGTVSGVTGTITAAGIRLVTPGQWDVGLLLVAQVLCFAIGSLVGGVIAPSRRLSLEMPYGLALILESILLAAGTVLIAWGYSSYTRLIWAVAMGMQNGLGTYFSGAVLRLTHMTGMVSDAGMILGEALRRRELVTADTWKLKVYIPVVLGFFVGSIIGGLLSFNYMFMLIPIILCFTIGIGYLTGRMMILRRRSGLDLQNLFPDPPEEDEKLWDMSISEDHPPLAADPVLILTGSVHMQDTLNVLSRRSTKALQDAGPYHIPRSFSSPIL